MCDPLPHGHPAKYPPEARVLLDRLCDKGQSLEYRRMSPRAKAKYASLEDSFRKIEEGTPVIVTGLTSAAGLRLNLLCGVAGNFDGRRWTVQLGTEGRKKIKPENLKTPGGVMRTNVFGSLPEETGVLFESVCRINHSCVPNLVLQQFRSDDGVVTFVPSTLRNIDAGEQLFIDYGVPDAPAGSQTRSCA